MTTAPAAGHQPKLVRACSVDELPLGERVLIDVGGAIGVVGVFHTEDGYFALRNYCPHHGAPLCVGPLRGVMTAKRPYDYRYSEGQKVIACPWHHWEFDLKSGRALVDPQMRVRTYPVVVEGSEIYIDLKGRVTDSDDSALERLTNPSEEKDSVG